MTEDACVLVVDDEVRLADMFSKAVGTRYETRTAYGGEEALELVDDDVDVVLLDRRMPEMSGDETLARLRETGLDAQVAMVTAVEPSADIVDLPFDDYLCKPASRETVRDLVDLLLRRTEYDEDARRHFEVARKIGLLETHLSEDELDASDTYSELKSRFEMLNAELGAQLGDCSAADLRAVIAGR